MCIVCMYVCMYACIYACMYACMHVCMYVCVCMYVPSGGRPSRSGAFEAPGVVGGSHTSPGGLSPLGGGSEHKSTGRGVPMPWGSQVPLVSTGLVPTRRWRKRGVSPPMLRPLGATTIRARLCGLVHKRRVWASARLGVYGSGPLRRGVSRGWEQPSRHEGRNHGNPRTSPEPPARGT